jgi:hypothetical protein
MVEKKCVEIDQQQAATTNKLTNEQWQALITLHRTLLHEHHHFFLAIQHLSSSPALKRLATKYAMPARMWRHCIHSFIDQQQATTTNNLTNEQWQALITLHRTLLREHHDLFLASQYPSSSPALERLATKYAMPARMWHHGIHSFIDQQQATTTNNPTNEQWQALIALHRRLLHEHHDFFLASQHLSSSPALERLATKYAMPARMWRHGIHSFIDQQQATTTHKLTNEQWQALITFHRTLLHEHHDFFWASQHPSSSPALRR